MCIQGNRMMKVAVITGGGQWQDTSEQTGVYQLTCRESQPVEWALPWQKLWLNVEAGIYTSSTSTRNAVSKQPRNFPTPPSTKQMQPSIALSRQPSRVFTTSGGRLDFVFANAGVIERKNFYARHPEGSEPPPELDQLSVDVDLKGVIAASYLALHYFRQSPGKGQGTSLVMTASCGGLYPSFYSPLYSAARRESVPDVSRTQVMFPNVIYIYIDMYVCMYVCMYI